MKNFSAERMGSPSDMGSGRDREGKKKTRKKKKRVLTFSFQDLSPSVSSSNFSSSSSLLRERYGRRRQRFCHPYHSSVFSPLFRFFFLISVCSSFLFFVCVSGLSTATARGSLYQQASSGNLSLFELSSLLGLAPRPRKTDTAQRLLSFSSPAISRRKEQSVSACPMRLLRQSSSCPRDFQQVERQDEEAEKEGKSDGTKKGRMSRPRPAENENLSLSASATSTAGKERPTMSFAFLYPPSFSSSSSVLLSSPSSRSLSPRVFSSLGHSPRSHSRRQDPPFSAASSSSLSTSSSRLSLPYSPPLSLETPRFFFLSSSSSSSLVSRVLSSSAQPARLRNTPPRHPERKNVLSSPRDRGENLLVLFSSSSSSSIEPTVVGLNATTVEEVLESIRPYLRSHGGNVKLISLDAEKQIVCLAFKGACVGCPSSRQTLYAGIQTALREVWPSVIVEEVEDYAWQKDEEEEDHQLPLTTERVEEALRGIKPAIEKLNATLEVLSISDGGDLQIRYRGPNAQTIRIGIEMELRDKLPPDVLGAIDIFTEETPFKPSSSPSSVETPESRPLDRPKEATRSGEDVGRKEDEVAPCPSGSTDKVDKNPSLSHVSARSASIRNHDQDEGVEDEEEDEDSLEPEPA